MRKRLIWIACGILAVGLALATLSIARARNGGLAFTRLVTRGNGMLEKADAGGAIGAYLEALRLSPESTDVRLDLANAYLIAGRPEDAARMCRETLELSPNSAAAYYLQGCALLREARPEQAAESLQQSWKIEPAVTALDFQMGMAQEALGQTSDAIRDFESVTRAVPDHPSAHFQLSQLYRRASRGADADRELAEHQRILARRNGAPVTLDGLERCPYTRPLAPFVLAQPDPRGIPVRYVEDTAAALGGLASDGRGPLAVIDYDHDGRQSLFVRQARGGFALLDNRGGHFSVLGRPLPAPAVSGYRAILTGDLDNDGFDDVVVLGEEDSRVFKFYAHGRVRDATRAAGLEGLKATSGLLADLDFTGNLDMVAVRPDGAGLAIYRNLGNLYFDGTWSDSGLPATFQHTVQVTAEDWGNEGLPGVFIARSGQPAAFYQKRRAGAFEPSNLASGWPVGSVLATGDMDNDLHPEAVIATEKTVEIVDRNGSRVASLPLSGFKVSGLLLEDIDNDGWLDIVAYGPSGVRAWRNAGHEGFTDVTRAIGLGDVGPVDALVAADFADDGAIDLITSSEAGLRFWRNQGGNKNLQLKLRLVGNRSNTSSLGVRVEVVAGDWRTSRSVRRMPLEIGVGQHRQVDALKVHWFDLSTAEVDVPVERGMHSVVEPKLPSGSCPYLYAWDGREFRFVTDILGAAPLGLPQDEKRYVPADPEELLALGGEAQFPPHNGRYEVRITDELREALYLDEARLVAVDHPVGTLVAATSKMHASGPFPAHEIRTLRPIAAPLAATRSDGLDVTEALARADGVMVSPVKLRRPQLRGLAEPYSVTLDFGPLPPRRPLVLVLTGWLHFGGGMANIAGAIDPTLPFPFPLLEAELGDGTWRKVEADVGTPAGKTKTIIVDLEGRLPEGARRLRLSAAFEIYWDSALLCEKAGEAETSHRDVLAARAELHWRGFSRYAHLPESLPLTPVYGDVSPVPPWDRTTAGWFTRYGPVDDLVVQRDDRLVLLAGGDELAVSFDAGKLPPPAAGMTRDFFLHVVGWDKDADFHVGQGWQVGPLPFQGMDDQAYGREPRPGRLDDSWVKAYNTRWVDPIVVKPGGAERAIP